jgi:hypothetical protein
MRKAHEGMAKLYLQSTRKTYTDLTCRNLIESVRDIPMIPYPYQSLIVIFIFALVHLFANRAQLLSPNFHSRFLSFGSGVAIAYVFIDLLPKLSKHDVAIKEAFKNIFPFLEKHVYIMALIGFLLFFIVDRSKDLLSNESTYYYLSLGSYALFNFLVGYAVVDKDNPEVRPLVLFAFAMALHYFMNDYSLYEAHGNEYNLYAKWFLISCLILGWLTGFMFELSTTAVALISAFIGGGVIMNITRHELPSDNPNNLRMFLASAAFYTSILLMIG